MSLLLSLSLEQIAALGVLLANGVFVIVAVAAYLRMNSEEDRRQRFLSHALGDSREAGQALKSIVRDLQRLMERIERAALGRGGNEASASERSQAGGRLQAESEDSALPSSEEEQMDFARLSPPEQCPTIGDYAEWRRLQQVELARLLQQRRKLLQALDQARAAAASRRGAGGNTRSDSLELQRARQRLAEMQAELERAQVERSFVEDRLLNLDEELTREKIRAANLQRRIESLEQQAAAVEA